MFTRKSKRKMQPIEIVGGGGREGAASRKKKL